MAKKDDGKGKKSEVKTSKVTGNVATKRKKVKGVNGPICALTCICKYAKVRSTVNLKTERRCSLGIVVGSSCNYPRWSKHLRPQDFA